MNHVTDEELSDAYYGSCQSPEHQHLQVCPFCRSRLEQLTETLDALRTLEPPERDECYGSQVWNRLAPRLAEQQHARMQIRPKVAALAQGLGRFRLGLAAAGLSGLLLVSFIAGTWTERERAAVWERTRERVLLMAMSEHLERSQTVLAELLRAKPDATDLVIDRERARDLADENRLLRQAALRLGDQKHAALLDDLGRVLLDLANGPEQESPHDLRMLQQRLESDELLPKVRTTSADAREEGEKL